ncbi:VWA domain-containing protein [Colwellia sp. E2M01]|uniref:VWA domain-containing protein n=1 Tax=Colwellia sp. E2M01 TaxID=2841561 RepID=UPI001C0839A0|nr:VWA domain-containing protein [Colwellia sp. E2M01]MBU2871262.1 VWA domain-containing protein [Colwellia sp. E2M01]
MAEQVSLFTQLTNQLNNAFINLDGFSFEGFSTNFHFVRPWWLLAFFGLFIVLFLLKKLRYYQSPWQHFLPAHLASALLENSDNQATQQSQSTQANYWLKPFIIGCCTIVALAGPAWQKLPQPVYQLERGSVLIMDMSYSMYATDVAPNRLTRARYKAIDLLKNINEGDVGLISYAGDAFVISPLTQDVKNIELLLPSLSPDIMPVPGANALAALTLAGKTLNNGGHVSGDIYWFTDDIDNSEISDIYAWANDNNHQLNILGVGSKNGAPIKLRSGELLKDNTGSIVIPKLPVEKLAGIAQRSRGVYHTMTNSDADIKALTAHLSANLNSASDKNNDNSAGGTQNDKKSEELMQGDQYQEQGPWLLILIIPLLLTYFRRGSSILAITWLMPLTLMMSLSSVSPTSYAEQVPSQIPTQIPSQNPTISDDENTDSSISETSGVKQFWQNLWQTSDQQGQDLFEEQDYQQAAEAFENSQWQASAHYKAGNFEQALQAYKQTDSAQSLYNQGNTLAQMQKIDEAIDAYKQALVKDPDLTHAKENLAQLEALKKQQEQQQQDSGDQSEQSDENQQQGDQGEQQKQDSQDGQQSEDGESQEQEGGQQDGEQSSEQSQDQSKEQSGEQSDQQSEQESQQAQEQAEKEQAEQEAQAAQAQESEEELTGDEKSLAQQLSEKQAQETEQKHQQLLNKVTDDPYLLLRNKMRIEYQKRKNNNPPPGVTKQW